MKMRLLGSVLVVLAFSAVGLAQARQPAAAGAKTIPRTSDGKPDLSGVWKTVDSNSVPMQLTAWGMDRFNYNKLPKANGVRAELDPIRHCYLPGLARIGPPLQVPADSIRVRIEGQSVPFPGGPSQFDVIEIRNARNKVWMIYQFNQEVREIYTDGRKHPEVVEDDLLTRWWNGHSVGSWDGDTFVVDTANLRDEVWLDNVGHEHRDLHVVERFRRVDAETLEVERTLTDAMALAKPYTTKTTLKLRPDVTFQENVVCDQYYMRRLGFGFGGLLGISAHPWQLPEERPNPTWNGENGTPAADKSGEFPNPPF